ncbi:hypothetical protein ACVWWI_006527 [Bradyrhizobium sp. USDA 3686]|uniref:hypothetical protein n=1 Tax=Bradyrhizobium canariense TaxID=255045 RepID=UPI001FEEB580|nr:hypothetical protein [Bradyrhizobium canariense]MBM7487924.1 hypothetical protein [Bradyrhizobium canariense]
MSKAMELIVAGYVKVRDRRALVDLLAHRRKVLAQLEAVSGINPENGGQSDPRGIGGDRSRPRST